MALVFSQTQVVPGLTHDECGMCSLVPAFEPAVTAVPSCSLNTDCVP